MGFSLAFKGLMKLFYVVFCLVRDGHELYFVWACHELNS